MTLFEVSPVGRRRPPHPSGCWWSGSGCLLSVAKWGVGHCGPDESSELSRDRGCRDGRALAVFRESSVAMMQTNLGLPGARSDLGWDVRAELGGTRGLAWSVLVMPSCLDQQPAGVAVTGLCDVPSMLLLPGGVLAGSQSEVAHQLAWVCEAPEVSDLGEQSERSAGRNSAEGAQPPDGVDPRLGSGHVLELLVDRGDLRVQRGQVAEHVLKGGLRQGIGQTLRTNPSLMALGPRLALPI